MRKIHQFGVYPPIPSRLSGLEELAYNLRWTWDTRTYKLFQHLDPEMLEKCAGNPVLLLRRISRERLEHAAGDSAFLAHLDGALEDLRRYMREPGWFRTDHPEHADTCVAYFCMEYGLAACLPIYSGGLGVLAGDHLKSASGLDIPLVAVGLLYNRGYFVQHLDDNGWQREKYRAQDLGTLPIKPVMSGETWRTAPGQDGPRGHQELHGQGETGGESGTPLKISLDIAGRTVWAQVWRAQVGRIPLYLLDTAAARERLGGPADHQRTLRRRAGGTARPGTGARHRRHARPSSPGGQATDLPSQRGARRLHQPRADAPPHGDRGAHVPRSPAGDQRGHPLHHPYPGLGRFRPVPGVAHQPRPRPDSQGTRADGGAVHAHGAGAQRRPA